MSTASDVCVIDVQLSAGLRGDFVKTSEGHLELHITEEADQHDPATRGNGQFGGPAGNADPDAHIPHRVVDDREGQFFGGEIHLIRKSPPASSQAVNPNSTAL